VAKGGVAGKCDL
jgi:hypothetical protein